MPTFNPQMLRLARLCSIGATPGVAAGIDAKQGSLAEEIGVSQGKVSKWEEGILVPDDEEVAKLALALKFPVSFFFHPGELYGFGTCMMFHRKRQSISTKLLNTIHARLNVTGIGVEQLLSFPGLSLRHSLTIPRYSVGKDGSPSDIARKVRADWKLSRGPISNLMSVVETAGAVIVPIEFPTDKIDAISVRPTSVPPLIFTSILTPADRQRFTIAHELGHLVMHDAVTPTCEDEAQEFASEFLMPTRDIRAELAGMSLDKAAVMKPKWRVSMAAILTKAKDTKSISDYRCRQLFIEMAPQRKRERISIDPDVPATLAKLVDAHIKKLNHSKQQLAEMTFCTEASQFDYRFLRNSQPRLRVLG